MIDTKKEQERDELHRAIWAIADELRGAVDGWDFKNYVLGTMFYRYISENLTSYINLFQYPTEKSLKKMASVCVKRLHLLEDQSLIAAMARMKQQVAGEGTYYGGITDMDDLRANLAENCVPEAFMDMDIFDYQVFLDTRRTMMAQYIREYYESLA